MHSGEAEVGKHIRTYLMVGAALLVFTAITVGASFVNLGSTGNIALALVIASIKGTMVAAIFMHLNHEKPWIYGSLILTVIGFFVLMLLPVFTTMDQIGTQVVVPVAAEAGHEGH